MFETNKVELTTEQENKLKALLVEPDQDIFMTDYHEKQSELEYEIMPAIKRLLEMCGEDSTREGLIETPFRYAKALIEHTRGYAEDPSKHLEKTFDVDHNELVLVKDIEFNSLCEHHLAPFHGVAHVGYIPGNKITGLSKLARVVEGYAQRLQVQERLTSQVADAIERVLQAQGVMVVIEAKHTCMCSRGIKKSTASTTTSAVRGAFKEETSARAEFLSLIK